MASEKDIDMELYMTDEISVKKRFVECVKQHNMVLKYVKDLDELISPVMFLDFVACSLMLCAIGLEAIMEGVNIRLGFTIEYLISMLIQLFMFYWYANEIMLESLKVCSAVWESQWYDCSNSVKKECVKHHNMIIKYVEDLDNLISSVMFLDFMVCSVMLCAIGLWAILEGANIYLIFTMEYLMSLLIELFMYSWYANEIILESSNVAKAAWESRWYDCGNNVKKGLILVIMRAQRPCILTAGGFYTMSLQTFLQILQATYSYVALLRQAQNL
ncbi:Odorant receptor 43a [Carabus blaptoides fortunei]